MRINRWVSIWIAPTVLVLGLSIKAKGESYKDAELRLSCSQRAADLLTAIQRDDWALMNDIHHRRENRSQAVLSDMRGQIRELEALQGDLATWEQQMSTQVTGQVSQMAANRDDEGLYGQASALARTLKVDAHAARVHARSEYLTPNVGMTELFR